MISPSRGKFFTNANAIGMGEDFSPEGGLGGEGEERDLGPGCHLAWAPLKWDCKDQQFEGLGKARS